MVYKTKFKILSYQNYLAFIKNSIDSTAYRNFYILEKDQKKDLLENGNLSCAYFVSSVLKLFDLIKSKHLTVSGTADDLEKSGWQKTSLKQIKPGDIIIWDKTGTSNSHWHIGFYLKQNQTISNSSKNKKIIKHHFTFNNRRKIFQVYTYNF